MDALEHRLAVGRRFGSRIASGDAVFVAGAGKIAGLPCTYSNGKKRLLSGMNRFMLLQVMKDQGWTDPRFFTADQVRDHGWKLADGAKHVGLQFLVANGADGLPLETPEAKLFQVFNAGEIAGVPPAAAEAQATMPHLEQAAMEAGFSAGDRGLRSAVEDWLGAIQRERALTDASGLALRVHLAASLLEVQTHLPPQREVAGQHLTTWADTILNDPLSLFQAVRDAEEMAAVVMAQVKSLEVAEQIQTEIAGTANIPPAGEPVKGEGSAMEPQRSSTSSRMDALFDEREAVLAVPFADKDRAKAAGAMWYAPESIWFVPKGVDLERFKEWNPNRHYLGLEATHDILKKDFSDEMLRWGLELPAEINADGEWHNVPINTITKKNKKGAYLLDLKGEPRGVIRNMYTGATVPWTYTGELLTPEQRAKLRQRAAKLDSEQRAQRQAAQDDAAVHARELVAMGEPADKHGYVRKKGISAAGLYQLRGDVLLQYPEFTGENGNTVIRPNDVYLIVPMCTAAGEIRAVQAINEDGGVKCFMRGAQKQGTMFVLGGQSFDEILSKASTPAVAFVEGMATGKTFHEASGAPTVVCFDAGNLQKVVAEHATRVPHHVLPILAVDNDQFFVERALGFVSERLGTNPHTPGGDVVEVASSANGTRSVELGDLVADGNWHQCRGGTYCVSLDADPDTGLVQSVAVNLMPYEESRKVQATFFNTGLEAGIKAQSCFALDGSSNRAALAIPEFASLNGRPTDWNDLAQREGIDMVRDKLRAVDRIAQRSQQQQIERAPMPLRAGAACISR